MAELLDIAPAYPLNEIERWDIRVLEYEAGTESRQALSLYPTREWDLSWVAGHREREADLIRALYTRTKGGSVPFRWKEPALSSRDRVYLGVGDGSTTLFSLPAKGYSSLYVTKNGTLLTVTTDYTVSVGTGENGLNEITFTAAPAAGAILEIGYLNGNYYPLVKVVPETFSITPVRGNPTLCTVHMTLREAKG